MANYALLIDNEHYSFDVLGEFNTGAGDILITNVANLPQEIRENGFSIYPLLSDDEFVVFYTSVQRALFEVISNVVEVDEGSLDKIFASYNELVSSDELHQIVIASTRNFQNNDFDFDLDVIAERLSKLTGLKLSSFNPELGKSHVQLRISRPNSLDINPPHRDAYLSYYKDVLNLWIPIFGCNSLSSLPVLKGSHLLSEKDILMTASRSASINGNTYVVPCVKLANSEMMHMTRPSIPQGSALVFTPYLIHGAAFNKSELTRFSLELRLSII